MGCDIFAVNKEGQRVVIQCKFSETQGPADREGVDDLQRACDHYNSSIGILLINKNSLANVGKKRIEELGEFGYGLRYLRRADILREMKSLPLFSELKKDPRKYQEEAIESSLKSLKNSGKALVEMATGLGKTIVMAEVSRRLIEEDPGRKILILAHTNPIVSQVESAIWSQLPKTVMTHIFSGSEKPISRNGVTVSTYQSLLYNYDNKKELPEFDVVMVDECHWAEAEGYSRVLEELSTNKLLMGVTATPWRGDGADISDTFGKPVFQMGIVEGISQGFLAKIEYEMFQDNVNWESVKELSEGKHTIKSLNSKLFLPIRDEELVNNVYEIWSEMEYPKMVTFCQNKEHAKVLCGIFNDSGISSQFLVDSHSGRERAKAFADFREGNFSNLLSVDLLNEGVDLPEIELVVFARITHSRRIFVQQLGRGLRLSKNKESVKVLDFVADIRRVGALSKLNKSSRKKEFYKGSGANVIDFDSKITSLFVEEYLSDIADLDEYDKPKLDFIDPDADEYEWKDEE